ncbi:MAG: hypothetical protein VZR73_15365, partial [Acutalibacteraceae bacterium]|nr:hypothetical protein [Acutalibacteraceae bacterium]
LGKNTVNTEISAPRNGELFASDEISDYLPMYLSAADSILMQNTTSCVNVSSEGSPILIRSVRRISFEQL